MNTTLDNKTCIVPGKFISGGLVTAKLDNSFAFAPLPSLALQIVVLSLTPRFIHIVLSRFNQPLFVSQILGGKGIHGITDYIFPKQRVQVLNTLAHFSSMFFLFKVGVKMDPKILRKGALRTYVTGWCCYTCSFAFGDIVSRMLHEKMKFREIIHIFSMSSFPVIAYTLADLNILNSDLGRLAIHVAMVADFLHSAVRLPTTPIFGKLDSFGEDFHNGLIIMLILMGLVIYIFFIARPVALWIVKNTPEGGAVKEAYIFSILISVLLCGLAGEYCGITASVGAFFLGLVIPDGPPLGSALVHKLNYMIAVVFMPLNMGIVGYKTDITKIHFEYLWEAALVILACIIGKIVGVFLPAMISGVPVRESLLLGLIMNLKGIVEVTVLNIWMDAHDAQEYYGANTIMVFGVVLVPAVITPLVKYLYDPAMKYLTYKRRSILQAKQKESDFRVLACVHTQDDVPAIIRLLEASNPTRIHPLTVYLLHLIELVGRASPLLIAHPRHKPLSSSSTSRSDRIINAFQQFKHRYHNLVSVHPFSTISPYASMHNDICSMSVDKRTSLIIFPFRRQDTICLMGDLARPVISNSYIKTLLQNLLRKSPCSVGILIDSNHLQAQSTCILTDMQYRVILLFFGGPDDREALAFAMNMVHHPRVIITVIRFYVVTSSSSERIIIDDDSECINIDLHRHKLLDDELVDHFRINSMHGETLTYKEIEVKDGSETIWAIRSCNGDFDLMLVGRQQITDSKLITGVFDIDDDAECEELGAIGEVVSSPEYAAEGSILIVHQPQELCS
ncbi:hypothetical protein MKW98_015037 [Papaver atlanticum]|uniref:Cation/H+ exchanger domain-containing protein n=1 Tax=Papaver atlanticum TaxID=357466 RepID=A0AAD4S6Y2_9MAGN|nr:hypothetical protein MKW98_015037 [Papaver atlanticum]